MYQLAKELNYIVTKENGLETEPSKAQNQAPKINNIKQFDTTTNSGESQLERYTINQIKQLFDYDIMLQNHPGQQQDIDDVMNVLHTAMNTSKPTIRIGVQDKPSMAVIGKFMKLDSESIMYAIKKFSEQTDRIKNPIAYLTTVLYTAREQQHLDKKNQISNEEAKVEPVKEIKRTYGKANIHQMVLLISSNVSMIMTN